MKTCRTCRIEKPLEDFSPKQRTGLSGQCRACATEAHGRWVAAHPDQTRDLRRASYARHAEENRERDRKRHRENPERQAWHHMMGRCHNAKDGHFHNYGGRGIRVADEWHGLDGRERFVAHVGPRPSPRHSIDRYPDNNGNYEPGNVRWATAAEQNRNKRTNRIVTVSEERRCVRDVARDAGINENTLRVRLDKGMAAAEAMTKPVRPLERMITVDGVTRSALEWSRFLGGNDALVSGRIWAGWDEVDAARTPLGARTRWSPRRSA